MEYLDIRDKNGNPTGVIKERSLVHADGDLDFTCMDLHGSRWNLQKRKISCCRISCRSEVIMRLM